jgi:hypothetical protein
MSILLNDVFVLKYLEAYTVSPPCAGYIQSTILLELHNATNQSYTKYSFVYKPNATGQATLMFCFLNRQNFWALGDVSMIDDATNVQRISNASFISGNLTDWTYFLGYNSVYSRSRMSQTNDGYYYPYVGSWFYLDIQYTEGGDGIFQSVSLNAGRNYNISFYLANPYGGNVSLAIVCIG